MNIILRVFLIFAFIFLSCTQARNIKNYEEPEFFYSRVNKAVNGKIVAITTINKESFEGTDLIIANDSTKWILVSSGERTILPTNQIHKVRVKDHFKGLVGGFLLGIPAGLGALFIAGGLGIDLPDMNAGEFTGMAYLIISPTIGALVGAGIGSTIGHKDDYIINPMEE